MDNSTKTNYSLFELKHALSDVFKSVYFANKHKKYKIQDSYFLNFETLLDYAHANNIDEMEYIRGIRETLLHSAGTYKAK